MFNGNISKSNHFLVSILVPVHSCYLQEMYILKVVMPIFGHTQHSLTSPETEDTKQLWTESSLYILM